MKKFVYLYLLCFATMSSFAQQGINYKALIKDNSGNVVANDLIVVQFQILQGAAQTNVYQETHTPTTDANGLIALVIGTGTVDSGVFNDIDWGSDDHYLNVQINTGSGLVDMGTTQFSTVPYAMHATTASIANNVSGLEAINEGNGIGWRLKGRDPNNYGNIGENAVDLSNSSSASATRGATGVESIAMGLNTTASNFRATAMGSNTIASGSGATVIGFSSVASGTVSTAIGRFANASGIYSLALGQSASASGDDSVGIGKSTTASGNGSIAIGSSTTASGPGSLALGDKTTASGNYSVVMGRDNEAFSYGETALGINSTDYVPNSTNNWNATDRLFVIGNGTSNTARNDALIVYKNGNAQFDGEIQHTSTGSANMIPIAYGTVESNGNILSGTGNFTASVNTGVFTISVTGEPLTPNNSACSVTPYSTAARSTGVVHLSNNLQVRIFDASGTITPTTFQFVIYKL